MHGPGFLLPPLAMRLVDRYGKVLYFFGAGTAAINSDG